MIEGTLLFDEKDMLRIIDSTGVRMTLKKDSLNWEAMEAANQRVEVEAPLEEELKPEPVIPQREQDVRIKFAAPVFTDIHSAQRELQRLSDACRSAGSSSPSMRVWTTKKYIVNGKPVTVSGYWAHPANIENAKRICASANAAQERLNRMKNVE